MLKVGARVEVRLSAAAELVRERVPQLHLRADANVGSMTMGSSLANAETREMRDSLHNPAVVPTRRSAAHCTSQHTAKALAGMIEWYPRYRFGFAALLIICCLAVSCGERQAPNDSGSTSTTDSAVPKVDGAQPGAWQIMPSNTAKALISVWGTKWNDVYAAGESGTILHYDGKAWTKQDSSTTLYLNEVWGLGPSRTYALGDKGVILTRVGNSSKWTQITQNKTYDQLFSIWGSSEKDLWICGKNGAILHYDGAWSLTNIKANDLKSIWGDGGDIYVVGFGQGGLLARYNGTTWTTQQIYKEPLYSLWAVNASDMFVAGGWNAGGAVLRNNGTGWTLMNTPAGPWLSQISGRSSQDVVAVGHEGRVLEYDGSQWRRASSPKVKTLFSVWVSSSGTAYAVGDEGVILRR